MDNILLLSIIMLTGMTGIAVGSVFTLMISRRAV